MWSDASAITCQKYYYIHTHTREDTILRINSSTIYFFGSRTYFTG